MTSHTFRLLFLCLILCCLTLTTVAGAKKKKNALYIDPLEGLDDNMRHSASMALDEDVVTDEMRALLLQGDNFMANQKDAQKALERYHQAEKIYRSLPGYAGPYMHAELITRVGRALSQLGRDCDAIPWFDQATALMPNEAMIYFSSGITYSNCRRDRESIGLYDRALALGMPRDQQAPCKYMLAKSLTNIGRWKRAIELFREVKKLDNWFPDVDLMLGLTLERSGEKEAALKHFNITMLRPNSKTDTRGHQKAGAVLTRLGYLAEAKKLLKKHVAANPNLHQFYNTRPAELDERLMNKVEPYELSPIAQSPDDTTEHPNQHATYHVTPLYPLDADTIAKQKSGEYVGPTIFEVDDFVSVEEANTIRRIFDQLRATRLKSPLTCFARTDKLDSMITNGILTDSKTLDDGASESQECVNATETILNHITFSTSTFIFHDQHPLLDEIHMRLERVIGLNHTHGASSQILRYVKNEEYDKHTDCAPDTRANDRAITVLIYLSDVAKGGETTFPRLNLSVKPKLGKLVVFTSLDHEGYCDILSEHASAKVIDGEKYVLQKWYHSIPSPHTGVEDLFRHARPRQSVINCDYTNSCREYIKYQAKAISKDTRLYEQTAVKIQAPKPKTEETQPAPVHEEL